MWKKILNLAQVIPLVLAAACAGTGMNGSQVGDGDGGTGGGGGGGGSGDGGSNVNPNCIGRQCQVSRSCPGTSPTTITGTVTIPAGNLPLYNANVYIPSGAVPPPPLSGPSCDRCDQIVPPDAAAKTTTDVNGKFTLVNVPSGKDIPVIIRVGKWRRVVTIPAVTDCTTTQLDASQTRLPRNKSEGNIPKIALSTGNQDALECLLRSKKLGIDDSEFTRLRAPAASTCTPVGSASTARPGPILSIRRSMAARRSRPRTRGGTTSTTGIKYDIVLLSCEGDQNATFKSPQAHAAHGVVPRYNGGRVFASHWHNIWISEAATRR